jgi:hypothetical protein
MFNVGDHVHADFGDGPVIAHISKAKHENAAGEEKYGVQAPDGSNHDLAYREPEDRDAGGSGGTFWSVK